MNNPYDGKYKTKKQTNYRNKTFFILYNYLKIRRVHWQ